MPEDRCQHSILQLPLNPRELELATDVLEIRPLRLFFIENRNACGPRARGSRCREIVLARAEVMVLL